MSGSPAIDPARLAVAMDRVRLLCDPRELTGRDAPRVSERLGLPAELVAAAIARLTDRELADVERELPSPSPDETGAERAPAPDADGLQVELLAQRLVLIWHPEDLSGRRVPEAARRLRAAPELVAAAIAQLTGRDLADVERDAADALNDGQETEDAAVATDAGDDSRKPDEPADTTGGHDGQGQHESATARSEAAAGDDEPAAGAVLEEEQPVNEPEQPVEEEQPVNEPEPLSLRAEQRRVARAFRRQEERRRAQQGPRGAAPFPRALVRATGSSDHDQLGEPVDREDLYGSLRMTHLLSFTAKRLIPAIGHLAVAGRELQTRSANGTVERAEGPRSEIVVSYGRLERLITTRRCRPRGARKRQRGEGVTGGGAAARIRRALLELERVEIDARCDSEATAMYAWRGTVLAEVLVDLGDELVPLRELEAHAERAIVAGDHDPRQRIGRRTSIVIRLSPPLVAAMADDRQRVWCDLDTVAGLTSATDLNLYLLYLADSPKDSGKTGWFHPRSHDRVRAKALYFPTWDCKPRVIAERRIFRMLGIQDPDLDRAWLAVRGSAERVAERVPAWGQVWGQPHRNNGCRWLVVEQLEVRHDHRCPAELRGEKTPSRAACARERGEVRRQRAAVRAQVQRSLLEDDATIGPPRRSDGAEGADRARRSAAAG